MSRFLRLRIPAIDSVARNVRHVLANLRFRSIVVRSDHRTSGATSMLHYSCDFCGQSIQEQRFVVKLEVYPALTAAPLTVSDLNADHLGEIADELREIERQGEVSEPSGAQGFRFDLCHNCHGQFLKDPLRRDSRRRLNFSEN